MGIYGRVCHFQLSRPCNEQRILTYGCGRCILAFLRLSVAFFRSALFLFFDSSWIQYSGAKSLAQDSPPLLAKTSVKDQFHTTNWPHLFVHLYPLLPRIKGLEEFQRHIQTPLSQMLVQNSTFSRCRSKNETENAFTTSILPTDDRIPPPIPYPPLPIHPRSMKNLTLLPPPPDTPEHKLGNRTAANHPSRAAVPTTQSPSNILPLVMPPLHLHDHPQG